MGPHDESVIMFRDFQTSSNQQRPIMLHWRRNCDGMCDVVAGTRPGGWNGGTRNSLLAEEGKEMKKSVVSRRGSIDSV